MDARAPQRGRGGLRALVLRRGLFGKQRQRCYDLHLSPVCVCSGEIAFVQVGSAGGTATEMVTVAEYPASTSCFVIFVFVLKIDPRPISVVPTVR